MRLTNRVFHLVGERGFAPRSWFMLKSGWSHLKEYHEKTRESFFDSMPLSEATLTSMVIPAEGGRPVRLTSGPSIDGQPEWSPDGAWIYFSSTASGPIPDLWRVPAAGGPQERITHGGGFQPKMSPDGTYLYYLDRPPRGAGDPAQFVRLLRMPVSGGEAAVIHDRVPPFYWCTSSQGIYFLNMEQAPDTALHRYHEGKVVRIGTLPFPVAAGSGGLTVSRDGRWGLTGILTRRDADLMLLENFRQSSLFFNNLEDVKRGITQVP